MPKQLPHYFRHLNARLLRALPNDLERVLEVGCSAGLLGEAYKNNNPDTVWHGVEINPDAVEHALERLNEAWVMNANNLEPNSKMQKEPYDAIVYGDVIEHLTDPIKSLPTHLNLLKPGGELIACIPNVQHWTVVKSLIGGDWKYASSGLLDNTHLRFFTRVSIWRMLRRLGYELIEQKRFSYEDVSMFKDRTQERDEILQLLELLCDASGMRFSNLDFRTYQYFIRAQKPM